MILELKILILHKKKKTKILNHFLGSIIPDLLFDTFFYTAVNMAEFALLSCLYICFLV